MTIKDKKQVDAAEEERQAQYQIVADIVTAQEIATELFGAERVTAKVAYEVFDAMPIEPGEVEGFRNDLKTAQAITVERFGEAARLDPEAVLGMFDRVFVDPDEDEDDSD